jgi:hypothetical protein
MKAVVWHADAGHPLVIDVVDVYKRLFEGLTRNLAQFGIGVIHLTTRGHEKYSDEWMEFDLDPHHVVLNREIAFCEFLKQAPDDHYWLTEPDSRMKKEWPEVTTDAVLIRRNDTLPITPSWRLGNPKSLPLWEGFRDLTMETPTDKWSWHGDSLGWLAMWNRLGKPDIGTMTWEGISIELRDYKKYVQLGSKYSENWKASNKMELLRRDGL